MPTPNSDLDIDGPVLPVLQSLDWADTTAGPAGPRLVDAMARPLLLAGRHVGYVAFGRDPYPTIGLEPPEPRKGLGVVSAEYEAAALMNLRLLAFEWRSLQREPEDEEPLAVLACTGHAVAAAAILDRSFLAQAHLILSCDRLVVAIPGQDLLLVGRADLPAAQLIRFATAVRAFHSSSERPVSPLTFLATNGVVDEIYESADDSLSLRSATDRPAEQVPKATVPVRGDSPTGVYVGPTPPSHGLDLSNGVSRMGAHDAGSQTAAGTRSSDRGQHGPLVPVLVNSERKDSLDVETQDGVSTPVYSQPLRLAGQPVAHILYGRLNLSAAPDGVGAQPQGPEKGAVREDSLQLKAVRPTISLDQVHGEARAGLRSSGLQWERFTPAEEGYAGRALGTSDVWMCTHTVAASGVLDPDFLRAAQHRLGCGRLLLGLPRTDLLLITSADLPPHRRQAFALMVAGSFKEASEWISPLCFYATDGSVDAVFEASAGLGPDGAAPEDVAEELMKSATAHWQAGDLEAARGAFEALVELGGTLTPSANCGLGMVLVSLGDSSGARAAFERARDSGHIDVAPVAGEHLGLVLVQEGDEAGARRAWQQAMDSGRSEAAQRSAFWLGMMLAERGDHRGTRDAMRGVTDPDLPIYSAAALNLGVALTELGDIEGARAALRRAIAAEPPGSELALRATSALGCLTYR